MAKQIYTVNAGDFPQEVEDYCDELGISTHCGSEMIQVSDDGSVLAEWLKNDQGIDIKAEQTRTGRSFIWIGIFGS